MKNTVIHQSTFPVTGMTCAGCASSVETILSHTEGVQSALVNFATNTVQVKYSDEVSPQGLHEALLAVGYGLILDSENLQKSVDEEQDKKYQKAKRQTIGSAILSIPVFILGMFFMSWEPGKWISMALSVPVLFYFGQTFFINAYKQAKHRKANMDTLVALSTGIAFLFSFFNTIYPQFWTSRGLEAHVYYEAAVVIITFISFGKMLEEKAKSSTSSALKKLMGLQPKTVHLVKDGNEVELGIEEMQEGDILLVKPGEKVPVDGQLTSGESYIDESMISGEPIPISKKTGDKIFAGTINQKGSFQFIAEKVGSDTLLAQIIKRVQEAQGSKAPIQKLVDKIAGVFVPTVIAISMLTFTIWMLVGGDEAFTHALLTSIAVLVIACPCALGLATPTAIMVGMGKGAENNILIRDAESLEIGHRVNTLVLDKTGTITEGKPSVTDIKWLRSEDVTEENLSLLFAIESQSEHPLAGSIVNYLKTQEIQGTKIAQFESITGLGIKAIHNGETYYVGNQRLIENNNIVLDGDLKSEANSWKDQAQTVVYFANSNQVLAIIGIKDQIKASSKSAIHQLQKSGIEVHMLTGDNLQTAEAVGNELSITNIRAEVLPSDKSEYVKNLQAQGKVVAMVGDGINDSEALAQADISIAMGHGSDIAMDVAKMTLITSDLEKISQAFKLSHLTVMGIRQNLFWAFIYNLIGIPIAAGLLYPINGFLLDPMIAGAAMAFSSVSVVLNSLRLKRIQLN
ncbi:MAG TPA: heavy metal translocating P-type ATPase [Algoriphagus sp.]|jgi:Cu2+-exporting ATPase|uniref:heavy metal translocating P-type ATPase n=1 Tax=unclassified Algoriphagus TaxID=2641541 RepID=UPI000C4900B0|nr:MULTISPECIES: heavy metal translocating P-type ATPase [unclassified Algoriphagus]MAL13584.1 copper-translocating P-type ATPase [Algoriphagus sp.]QYH38310.1 copper-translocating P-type ATPase [Algoriphagus sp. NBT04N3]HCB45817.1 heavy metal translocating P-type ATPase [Algoriphagus sp.]HCD88779.1 heavy metal translocating P-type ATPase [Algoriphagus sp.]HCH45689.1 heavy metal translocating P-type ATPase [Algoriphagus sp.]|tara:strand:+ start:6434 stop:8659 length:2226 start_codon:yes stop_codon:yes gene_type:complete